MTRVLLNVSSALSVAALLGSSACSETSTSPAVDPATTVVEAVTQTSISGIVGAAASPAPVVRLSDSKTHQPLPNIPVEFRVVTDGGYVTNAIVATDAKGQASPGEWRFATRPGSSALSVYLNGTYKLQFTATLLTDVPAQLVAAAPTDQASLPGESVQGPSVNVRDQFDNPVSGILVSFTVTDGGGALEKSEATTVNGFAGSSKWTLGTSTGHDRVLASAAGLTPVVFNAEALDPTSIKWYELDSVRSGSASLPPIQMGVTSARLGITHFDSCLCKKQDGYFIDEVLYSDYGGEIWQASGRYSLNNATLTISSLSDPATIQNGTLILQRPDFDFGFLFTWVYKEIN
jgi:hypothetical protein